MKNTPHDISVSASDPHIDPEQNLPTPHFDEEAIQSARPAVPLVRNKPRSFWPLALVLVCGSSLVGGVMGLALSRYEKRSEQISRPAASVAPEGAPVSSDRVVKSTEETSAPLPQAVSNPEENPNGAAASGDIIETTSTHSREKDASGDESVSDQQSGDARATLHGALNEWIAATNARDLQRQMGFYNHTVNAFYRTRNVPREAVRAEKSRVFGRADVIDIRAAAPGIRMSSDGRSATMRFRKKYAIEGGGEDRRGEVVQELRWRRTDDGWKIVSERDLRVIN